MLRNFSVLGFTILLIALLAGSVGVFAHSGAKGVVKERMALMKSLGKAMKSISKMARGKAPIENKKIAIAAREISRQGDRIPEMFPEGSSHGVTEASPAIWSDPTSFNLSAKIMVDAANRLLTASQTNDADAIKAAYRSVAKTCSGCHKQYRIKKKR